MWVNEGRVNRSEQDMKLPPATTVRRRAVWTGRKSRTGSKGLNANDQIVVVFFDDDLASWFFLFFAHIDTDSVLNRIV